jgi:hypothetical protein
MRRRRKKGQDRDEKKKDESLWIIWKKPKMNKGA